MAFKEVFKSSRTMFLTTVAVTAIGFISSVVTARILGPEGRGLLSGALLITTLTSTIASFGLAFSYIYHRGAGHYFAYKKYVVNSAAFIGVLAASLAWASFYFNKEIELHQQLMLIVFFSAVAAIQSFFMNLSQMQSSLNFVNLLRFLAVFLNFIFLIAIYLFFEQVNFKYILYAQFFVAIILMLMAAQWAANNIFTPVANSYPPRASLKKLLRYAFNQHGTVMVGTALTNFDKIYLLKVGTMAEFGFYSVAFLTSRLIGAIQEALNTALYSKFAGKDEKELSHNVGIAFRMTFLPMILIALIGAAFSPWFIPLVYGEKFSPMVVTFIILLFECVVSGAGWTLAQRFNAAGRPGLVLIRQLVSVIPVVICLPVLPRENISVYLSLLMLLAAILRLLITLAIYPTVLKEPIPRLVPYREDMKKLITRLRSQ